MDQQQEIEHIARLIEDCPCDECTFCLRYGKECKGYVTARKIIKNGYGNVRAVVEDVAERIKTGIFCELADDLTFKMVGRIEKIIKEVLNEHEL